MIIVVKQNASKTQLDNLLLLLQMHGMSPSVSVCEHQTVIGCVGVGGDLDFSLLEGLEIVESVQQIDVPYKTANRQFHPESSVVSFTGGHIGNGHFCVMAGPCSVESEEQVVGIAQAVKSAGADVLRGGAFKPRTSPYSFQGLGAEGIRLLLLAKRETGLPIVTELMEFKDIELFNDVDIIQIGARNMQNFNLLKEVGAYTRKPVLLKRGMSSTLQELLMSAEYIMSAGNPNVILCERGIRTFETATRNTLDLAVVPILHRLSHLPVMVDPSHASGCSYLVEPVATAAAAVGADGLMIEVHNAPSQAKSDGAQCQTPMEFQRTMEKIKAVRKAVES